MPRSYDKASESFFLNPQNNDRLSERGWKKEVNKRDKCPVSAYVCFSCMDVAFFTKRTQICGVCACVCASVRAHE